MKLFLTGATGFIGTHVLKQAHARGANVTAVRRSGSRTRLETDASPEWLERPLDAIEPRDLSGFDALVHLASVGVSPQKATLEEMVRWNVGATGRLLETAAAAGLRRVVLAGSFAEYGRAADRYEFLPTNAPLEPTSAYAASKAAACMLAMALAGQHGLELCYLRIFSAFGEGQHESNFFPSLRRAALAGEDFPMTAGEQVRDFIRVEEVADAILDATAAPDVEAGRPRVMNIASGRPVALREFAQEWWSRLDARGKLLVGAVPYRSTEPKRFAALMPQSGSTQP